MGVFDSTTAYLDRPLEQRIKDLMEGRGPAHVTQAELRVVAERWPEVLTSDWKRVQRARHGDHEFSRWQVIVVPTKDPVGKHEARVLKAWEPKLRPLERQVVETAEATRQAREKLYAALTALAEARAKAARRSGVTEDGQPIVPPDDPRVAELEAEARLRELDVEACEADEQRAMVAYTRACQAFEAERRAAKTRDMRASGQLTG
jgi:hypothetical protein